MYTTANVRKFLNASNVLMLESNENVINKFTEMILEKFENIDKTQLEQLAFTLKDDISKEHLSQSLQKKKKWMLLNSFVSSSQHCCESLP